jgi:hypothetical protein
MFMRGFLTVLMLLILAAAAPAGAAWDPSAPVRPAVDATDPQRLVVTFDLPPYTVTETDLGGVPVAVVDLPGVELRREAGLPELPQLAVSLALPAEGRVSLEILELVEEAVPSLPVIPSAGHLPRNTDPDAAARSFGAFYDGDAVWPPAVAELGRPFLVGASRGVSLRLLPLRYDAGTGRLLAARRVTVAVVSEGTGGINPAPVVASAGLPGLADRLFVNAEAPSPAKAFSLGARPGRLLMVVPDEFRAAVEPLVQWKTRRGIEVETVSPAALGGTEAAIAAAIADRWYGEGLDWVLLLGDREWVPTRRGTFDGSDSDTRYALVAGDDTYPDLFVSRISVRSAAEAAVQAAKFVAYERDPWSGAAAGAYGRAAGIASDEGTPADDVRVENLRADLLAGGFSSVDQLYQRTGAGAADVRSALVEGRSLVNYLGHGTGTGWTSVPFSAADVAGLANTRWPWIVDVSCSNGEFARTTCFAESWLRAGTAAAPAGAVAVVAASSLAPWTPPTVMQAEIIDLLAYDDERTLGALHMAGLARVLDVYGGLPVATQVFEQFNLFGDASLQVRTRAAASLAVELPDAAAAGDTGFELRVAGPAGAVIAVSAAGALYGHGIADGGGTARVTWLRTPPAGAVLDVTVTAPETAPWMGSIAVTAGWSAAPDIATGARLLGNHPNPFNPVTAIRFVLEQPGRTVLTVHDVAGRRVRTLVDADRGAGEHAVLWDGADDAGRSLGSGVYLYRLAAPGGEAVGRMTLVK